LKEITKTISAVKFPSDFENHYKTLLSTFKAAKRRLQICSIRIIDTYILVEMKETLQSSFDSLTENLTDPFENMIEEATSSRNEYGTINTTPTRSAQNVKNQPNKLVIQAFAKTNYLSSVSSKFVKSSELC
jgi:poly(3-hydroxyalkanoate) synthetase